ncbi:DUF2270 domain-containing protein [Halosimplex salinum]|uniref:DUF2270 domain-containing protein n=1 Tax=Halosimplex salinum TaxID=1710538 RepID=UPI000F47760A|nr:DUF2270 domain-containing protein [Halosimplex salinum]
MSDQPDPDDSETLGDLLERVEENLPSLLGHMYRGEMDRANTWRGRLDQTTNWAVTIMAALLTFVFTSPDNPHYLLLIGMVTVEVFHVVDTRRYLTYDVWRSRVRLLEEDVFAAAVDPDSGIEHADWQRELGKDLRRPALKTPLPEAFARRLRRIYLPLLLVLLAAWIARITVFASDSGPLAAAAIVGIPGAVVIGAVAVCFLAAIFVAYRPRDRQAMGELYERDKQGEWKE